MNIEEIIKNMGYGFKSLTFNSRGEYSCKIYLSDTEKEFLGNTPEEVILKANYILEEYEGKFYNKIRILYKHTCSEDGCEEIVERTKKTGYYVCQKCTLKRHYLRNRLRYDKLK